MTREEVVALAQEAGITFITEHGVASATPEWLELFAKIIASAERKACALVCDNEKDNSWIGDEAWEMATKCAELIRARGQ